MRTATCVASSLLASHEVCDKEPVDQETAHRAPERGAAWRRSLRHATALAALNLFDRRRLALQCAPERRHVDEGSGGRPFLRAALARVERAQDR